MLSGSRLFRMAISELSLRDVPWHMCEQLFLFHQCTSNYNPYKTASKLLPFGLSHPIYLYTFPNWARPFTRCWDCLDANWFQDPAHGVVDTFHIRNSCYGRRFLPLTSLISTRLHTAVWTFTLRINGTLGVTVVLQNPLNMPQFPFFLLFRPQEVVRATEQGPQDTTFQVCWMM